MMRKIWNILAVIAIANLITIALVMGVLFATDKLSPDKLTEIRQMVMRAAQETDGEGDTDDAEGQEDPASVTTAPLGSPELQDLRLNMSDIDRQKRERLRRQVEDLKRSLTVERERLDEQWTELRSEREAFAAERERISELEGGKQFRTAVRVLEGLRPEQARDVVLALIAGQDPQGLPQDRPMAMDEGGGREGGMRRAVSYINAMQDRQRGRLMASIAELDPALAAELLERLRTRGLVARGP